MVPIKEASAVAIKTACASMPDAERMLGFTARMYAMVMKVVIPATTSVRTVVLFSLSLKNFSNISTSLFFNKILFYYIFIDMKKQG